MKKVILVSGHMRTGKNQFAEYLQDIFEEKGLTVSTDLFAKTLKDCCKEDFKSLSVVLDNLAEELKEIVNRYTDLKQLMINPHPIQNIEKVIDKLKIKDHNWYEDKTDITRIILQIYGTEIFRKRVDDNWWVHQMKKRVLSSSSDVIIITDTRFPNEITEMFDDNYETITVRIERNINTKKYMASHASETSLDNWKEWNYIVENNGTLRDLMSSAKTVVKDLFHIKKETIGLFTRQCKENIQWVNLLNS